MVVIAVAGGLGDFGRLVVDALLARTKHDVYCLSRKAPDKHPKRTSPVTGREYYPILQTDYSSESALRAILDEHNIHTVICTLGIDWPDVAATQCRLIRAAASSSTVQRFMPSEFNVDYDLEDDILPYPEKEFHAMARRELEKTRLEFTYVYPGMFMDYFGLPRLDTHLRPLYNILDIEHGVAIIPGDGNRRIAFSYTKDIARYIARAMELERWPTVFTVVAESMTPNDLVKLTEKIIRRKLKVSYEPVEKLRNHEMEMLPGNGPIATHFPGGMEQLRALISDLSASMALGAYDFRDLKDSVDLVEAFRGKEDKMMSIEEFLRTVWAST